MLFAAILEAAFSVLSNYAPAVFPDQVPWPGMLVYAGETEQLRQDFTVVHELYLDLAKQATPVIEVGAAKKVTVEGKELEIKEYEGEAL